MSKKNPISSDNAEERICKTVQQILQANNSLMLKEQKDSITQLTDSINEMISELKDIKSILRDGVYKN